MSDLFIRSRTWGYKDSDGAYRIQAIDGNYINALGEHFLSVTLAMVVVDPVKVAFVKDYNGQLSDGVKVLALQESVIGSLPQKSMAQGRNFWVIAREILAASHVVVFMSSLSAVWAALLAKGLGKKLLVYSGNDWGADTALRLAQAPAILRTIKVLLVDKMESWVLRSADVRLVNSPQLFAKCEGRKGIAERVRPNSRFSAEDVFFRADTCCGRELRIIYPAAIIPRKNHVTLLQALRKVRARGVNATLWLPGAVESAQILQDLERLAHELGVAAHVHFLGYVAGKTEMLELLRASDIFALPSLNEGFPRVIWEAMLQSLPCAVSRIPNIVADIGQRDVALMFDPLDAVEMETALLRIVRSGELRRRLICNGREYAREIFGESWDEQLARILPEWV